MKRQPLVSVQVRRLWARLGPLLFVCQRTPVGQVVAQEARTLGVSGFTQIAKWTVSVVSGLGAFDCVSGATVVKQIAPTAGSATVAAPNGNALNFVVQVTGAPSTAKSWKLTGTLPTGLAHSNATNSNTDSVTGVPRQNGNFPVTFTAYEKAGYGGGSKAATFTIIVSGGVAAPVISVQPLAVSINAGSTAVLSVGAAGAASYQWYAGASGDVSSPVAGAAGASFTTPALTASSSYWVKVTNAGGSVNSASATVSVIDPPVITSQPGAGLVNPGGFAILSVAVSGTSPLFQWYQGESGDSSTPMPNGTGPTFTTPALGATTPYWVLIRNQAGTVNSNTALVVVTLPPAIYLQPMDAVMGVGGSATLSVAASGAGLGFQWYLGASGDTAHPVPGATGASVSISGIAVKTSYWVAVSNSAGMVASHAVFVVVQDSFASWAAGRFSAAELANPLVSGAARDPDGDGLTNEQEYVYGTSPALPGGPLALSLGRQGGTLSLTFGAAAASGAGYAGLARHYAVESSVSLGAGAPWVAVAGFSDLIGLGQVVSLAAPAEEALRFYRVRVWLAPE